MAYAFGYTLGIDKEMVHEDLLAAGDAVNAYGLEVVDRKTKIKIVRVPFVGRVAIFKMKVKFEDGNVMKFKFTYKLHSIFRLVTVEDQKMQQGADDLAKQLEALGLGGIAPTEEKTNKKPIGFVTE